MSDGYGQIPVKHVLSVKVPGSQMADHREAMDVLRTAGVPDEAVVTTSRDGEIVVARWVTVGGVVQEGRDDG